MPTRITRPRDPAVQQASAHQHSTDEQHLVYTMRMPSQQSASLQTVVPPLVVLPASLLDEQINTDTLPFPHVSIYNTGPPLHDLPRRVSTTCLYLPASLLGDDTTTATSSSSTGVSGAGVGGTGAITSTYNSTYNSTSAISMSTTTATESSIITNTSVLSTSSTSSSNASISPAAALHMLECAICSETFQKIPNSTVIPECQHRFCIGCVNYCIRSIALWNSINQCFICKAKTINDESFYTQEQSKDYEQYCKTRKGTIPTATTTNTAPATVDEQISVVVGSEDIANCPLPSSARVETNHIPNPLALQQTGQEPVCNSSLVIASSKRKGQVSNDADDDSPTTSNTLPKKIRTQQLYNQ